MTDQKKCKHCLNQDGMPVDGMVYCRLWRCDVWQDSIACRSFDDTEPF